MIVTCASLALADAGIMMYDLVASVSVVCLFLLHIETTKRDCVNQILQISCSFSSFLVCRTIITLYFEVRVHTHFDLGRHSF